MLMKNFATPCAIIMFATMKPEKQSNDIKKSILQLMS